MGLFLFLIGTAAGLSAQLKQLEYPAAILSVSLGSVLCGPPTLIDGPDLPMIGKGRLPVRLARTGVRLRCSKRFHPQPTGLQCEFVGKASLR